MPEVPVADGVTLPGWLAVLLIVLAVAGPIVSGVVASVLTYRATNRTTAANVRATELTRDTEHAKQQHEVSKSNRELILQAIEWTRSESELTSEQGWAMLDGLSRIPGLTQDDAVLFMAVTRPQIERRLSDARRAVEVERDSASFIQDAEALKDEGGADDTSDQGDTDRGQGSSA